LREFLGAPEEMIDTPTPAQRELFGPKRRRVPEMMDLKNPILLGPVHNQEHHMNGVVARRNNFNEPILNFLINAYEEFGNLTGRYYGLISEYKTTAAETFSCRSVARRKTLKKRSITCANIAALPLDRSTSM